MAKEKKYLDYEGVKHLWSKVNMQDYPNNDMLMSVIQAIDETKLDKNELIGTNELIWDGAALDNIQVDWFMHLVSYDIPVGFEYVINGKYAWNNGEFLENNLFVFSGDNYIGLSHEENPSLSTDIAALAILKDNTLVFDANYPISGFYMKGDPKYGEFISPLYYEWNLLDQKANKEDLAQSDWNQNDEAAPDYIKNRPFYETPEGWTQIQFVGNDKSSITTGKLGLASYIWAEDKAYRLRVDGVEYTFDRMTQTGTLNAWGGVVYYIGALYIPLNSNMNWSEYPFCLCTADFTNVYAVFEDGTTNHTVEFFTEGEIHKIDIKFLPIASDDDIIKMLVELDMVAAVADSDNAMLADENENILLW